MSRTATATVRSTKAAAATNGKAAIESAIGATATATVPDYANMAPAALLASWRDYVKDSRSDASTPVVNAMGAAAIGATNGELSALCAVAIGLRKAYGRTLKAKDITDACPGIVVPDGYVPTFGVLLSACRLRPDNAAERKAAQEFASSARTFIRKVRTGK